MDLEDSLLTEREEVEVPDVDALRLVLTLRLLLVVDTLRLLLVELPVLVLTLRLLLVAATLRLPLLVLAATLRLLPVPLLFAVEVLTLRLFAVFDATLTLRLPLGSAGPTERPARFLSHPPLTLRLGV